MTAGADALLAAGLERLGRVRGQALELPTGGEEYRWGEFMLSAVEASELLATTTSWDELRDGFVKIAPDPQYHLDPSRMEFTLLLPERPSLVLDVGCGLGLSSEVVARLGHAVVALDRSAFRARFAAERTRRMGLAVEVIPTDLEGLPAAPGTFDAAIMLGVLEWLGHGREGSPDDHQWRGLQKLAELVKPGGRLIIVIENRFGWPFLIGRPEIHVNRRFIGVAPRWLTREGRAFWRDVKFQTYTHSLSHLRRLLEQAGFEIEAAFGALPQYHRPAMLFPIIWRGQPAARGVSEAYRNFRIQQRGRPGSWLLQHLHALVPRPAGALFAPGFVISAVRSGATAPPSILDGLAPAHTPLLHIGQGANQATTIQRWDGSRWDYLKRARDPSWDPGRLLEVIDLVSEKLPELVIPTHRTEAPADGRTLLWVQDVGGRPLRRGDLADAAAMLGRLHRSHRLTDAPFVDIEVVPGTTGGQLIEQAIEVVPALEGILGPLTSLSTARGVTHGDWMPQNLRRIGRDLGAFDWALATPSGAQALDCGWFLVNLRRPSRRLLDAYVKAAGRPVSPDELLLSLAFVATRHPARLQDAREKIQGIVAAGDRV